MALGRLADGTAVSRGLFQRQAKTIMAVFGIILIVLGALFASDMAGQLCYIRDHIQVERTHHRNPEYLTLLKEYEIIGAIIGVLPGGIILLIDRRRKSTAAP